MALLEIDRETGWLESARRVESPNFDPRPRGDDCPLDLIVIHGISLPPGEYAGDAVDRLFTNCLDVKAHPYFSGIAGLKVSSHFFVRRDASITQYVSIFDRAWHAGDSEWCGRTCCNDFSIGIEVEGTDDDPYDPEQFDALAGLTAAVMRAIGLDDPNRVVGHSDIAPQRKTDPGPNFAWRRFRAALAEELSQPA